MYNNLIVVKSLVKRNLSGCAFSFRGTSWRGKIEGDFSVSPCEGTIKRKKKWPLIVVPGVCWRWLARRRRNRSSSGKSFTDIWQGSVCVRFLIRGPRWGLERHCLCTRSNWSVNGIYDSNGTRIPVRGIWSKRMTRIHGTYVQHLYTATHSWHDSLEQLYCDLVDDNGYAFYLVFLFFFYFFLFGSLLIFHLVHRSAI